MVTRANQGFRQDLNFKENVDDSAALGNLGGPGIADDIRIIQNNLRNIGTVGYVTFTKPGEPDPGFFSFPNFDFIFTQNDRVGVSKTVSVGSTSLHFGVDYFVSESNNENRFKLSFTRSDSAVGVETVSVTSVGSTDFHFIRKEPVVQPNLINFIQPDIQDDEHFNSYLSGTINSVMDSTQSTSENAGYSITKKYKGTDDTASDEEIKLEGTVNLFDPGNFNATSGNLSDSRSPSIFIGNTRAFSADNNPWAPNSTELRTSSEQVTIGELVFENEIDIEGMSVLSDSEVPSTDFDYKVPIVVNGETYYLLLKDPNP